MRLLELERRLAGVGERLRAAEAATLIADDFLEFGSSGRVWRKAEIVAAMSDWPPIEAELQDCEVRELAPGLCLVTYRLVGPSGATLRSSIWRRDGESWQIIFHHGSKAR